MRVPMKTAARDSRCAAVFALALILSGCWESAGEGELAAAGRAEGDKIIAAIEAYRADHMQYPESLDKLVPTYLESTPLPVDGNVDGVRFLYVSPRSDRYRLLFKYFGSASYRCAHDSDDRPAIWSCVGSS